MSIYHSKTSYLKDLTTTPFLMEETEVASERHITVLTAIINTVKNDSLSLIIPKVERTQTSLVGVS